jgi:radical SAM superfamily enzyme YgiQ (UPF0313 family)
VNVVLISTYDLGHQPFGLASAAAWLRERGHSTTCVDLAINPLPSLPVREAEVVAFFMPMHTATRLAVEALSKVRLLNPRARLLAYGLYAPVNAEYLKSLGVETVVGGEYEQCLADAIDRAPGNTSSTFVSLDRLNFRQPDRTGLPALHRYSRLHVNGQTRIAGYTEASRGCKHLCRHCPVVPVYEGVFRVVPRDIVLEDIRRQVALGAQHITFGDPDFFNGPAHALRIVEAMHREFPALSYDATIKIEHLRARRSDLAILRDTGCLFITTAVESVDDAILAILDKGHTRDDFIEVAEHFRTLGIHLAPTFVPFTPWTTRDGYAELLRTIRDLDLVANVSPIQLALRLLLPAGSKLLDHPAMRPHLAHFDAAALLHRWRHPDPSMDALAARVLSHVSREQKQRLSRGEIFAVIWRELFDEPPYENFDLRPRATIPYMDEPWYC